MKLECPHCGNKESFYKMRTEERRYQCDNEGVILADLGIEKLRYILNRNYFCAKCDALLFVESLDARNDNGGA